MMCSSAPEIDRAQSFEFVAVRGLWVYLMHV